MKYGKEKARIIRGDKQKNVDKYETDINGVAPEVIQRGRFHGR